jgi:hypothetical protein
LQLSIREQEMHSSTSNSELSPECPQRPWGRIFWGALVFCAVMLAAWELHVRGLGYAPTLNDTSDLWAAERNRVSKDSIVIIGASRVLFDLDLDILEKTLGQRPIQLAMAGSCAYPVLQDLADDPNFGGTVICGVVPAIFFAPAGPPVERAMTALERRKTQTPAQLWGHHIGMFLQERFAFIQQDDLTLKALVRRISIPNRPTVHLPPALPPYFSTIDRDRRTRMVAACEKPGPLQTRVKDGWLPLFTPPPPPPDVPKEAFMEQMGKAFEKRFQDTIAAVNKIRERGGRVVFVRCPSTGPLLAHEQQLAPRERFWDPLVQRTGAPGIHFQDYPELAGFDCPEYSHLSAGDSVLFTERLAPHLENALKRAN